MSCSNSALARLAAAWLAVAVGLAGCMAGPNFVAPVAPAVSRYTMQAVPETQPAAAVAPGTAPEDGYWWQLLQSAQLDATVRSAVDGNRDLRARRQRMVISTPPLSP